MYRTFASTLILCCFIAMPAGNAQGQTPGEAVVNGLAMDDLLNIRERPSPLGRTLGKLPNGAIVRRHQCEFVDGYEWCRVVALEAEELDGWAPARYLLPSAMSDEMPAETVAAATGQPAASGLSIPEGLEARFAGEPNLPAAASRTLETALLAAGSASLRRSGIAAPDAAGKAADPAVPIPTPRPDPDGRRVEAEPASAQPRGGAIRGEIPCARYVGQPMTRCEAQAVRIALGAADVTVIWPDGGTRLVEFRDGVPAGSNSGGEFRFTREGSLDMIRIGVSERFEIPNELSLGD